MAWTQHFRDYFDGNIGREELIMLLTTAPETHISYELGTYDIYGEGEDNSITAVLNEFQEYTDRVYEIFEEVDEEIAEYEDLDNYDFLYDEEDEEYY